MADRYVAQRVHRNYSRSGISSIFFTRNFSRPVTNNSELEIIFEIPPVKARILAAGEGNEDLTQLDPTKITVTILRL